MRPKLVTPFFHRKKNQKFGQLFDAVDNPNIQPKPHYSTLTRRTSDATVPPNPRIFCQKCNKFIIYPRRLAGQMKTTHPVSTHTPIPSLTPSACFLPDNHAQE